MTEPGEETIQSIVSAARLNRFMSSPVWTPEQWEAAIDVIEGVESSLAGQLNTYILPVPFSETVTVLRSGQVNTSHPVSVVTKINGVVVTGDLPTGWKLQEHRLYTAEFPSAGLGQPFTLDTWGLGTQMGEVHRVDGLGPATVEYDAGWGNVPALRLAILKKARTVFRNQHDDSIVVRDLDAAQAPRPDAEEWTDVELKELDRFRNLTAWR